MPSKTSKSRPKYSRALLLLFALAGLVYLSFVASTLSAAKIGNGVRVNTVARPQLGTIEAPGQLEVVDDQATAAVLNEVPDGGSAGGVAGAVSCEDLMLMVDSDHVLSPDYVPPNLGYLIDYGIAARGTDIMVRQEVAEQLGLLLSDAAQDGVEILVASGYRPYWEQAGTYEWFKDTYGEEAGRLSVPPGQSEHQLGTAVDFTSSQVDYELVHSFEQTAAGAWLADHAAQYGFVLSYPEGHEEETGVRHEPWHYRYVGVEKALEVKASEAGVTPSLYQEGLSHCYES